MKDLMEQVESLQSLGLEVNSVGTVNLSADFFDLGFKRVVYPVACFDHLTVGSV